MKLLQSASGLVQGDEVPLIARALLQSLKGRAHHDKIEGVLVQAPSEEPLRIHDLGVYSRSKACKKPSKRIGMRDAKARHGLTPHGTPCPSEHHIRSHTVGPLHLGW